MGLRCRNLFNFPSRPEVKVPGGAFASSMGRGLHLFHANQLNPSGSAAAGFVVGGNRIVRNPPLIIAKRMQFRQLIEYQKIDAEFRSKLIMGLKYANVELLYIIIEK